MKRTHYGKVKTNRVTLKKYLEIFSKNKAEGESFEAPRPKPGRMASEYYALLKLNEGSRNHTFFTATKKLLTLDETTFNALSSEIKFKWEA
jgi:hypothetical protein